MVVLTTLALVRHFQARVHHLLFTKRRNSTVLFGLPQIEVVGLTCASCVIAVERALSQVPGVSQARVNLVTSCAEVDVSKDLGSARCFRLLGIHQSSASQVAYDANVATSQQLVDAISSAGYSARITLPSRTLDGCTARLLVRP